MTDKDTIIAAQEAEILRLQQSLNDIKEYLETGYEISGRNDYGMALFDALSELNRITGHPMINFLRKLFCFGHE